MTDPKANNENPNFGNKAQNTQKQLDTIISCYENVVGQSSLKESSDVLLNLNNNILSDYYAMIAEFKALVPKDLTQDKKIQFTERLQSFFEENGVPFVSDKKHKSKQLKNNTHLQVMLYLKAHALTNIGFDDAQLITGRGPDTNSTAFEPVRENIGELLTSLKKVKFGPAFNLITKTFELDREIIPDATIEGAKLGNIPCQYDITQRYLGYVAGNVLTEDLKPFDFPENITESMIIKWAHDARNAHLKEGVTGIQLFLQNTMSSARALHQEGKGVTEQHAKNLLKMVELAKQISGDQKINKMLDQMVNFDTKNRDYQDYKKDLAEMVSSFDELIVNWVEKNRIKPDDVKQLMSPVNKSTKNAMDELALDRMLSTTKAQTKKIKSIRLNSIKLFKHALTKALPISVKVAYRKTFQADKFPGPVVLTGNPKDTQNSPFQGNTEQPTMSAAEWAELTDPATIMASVRENQLPGFRGGLAEFNEKMTNLLNNKNASYQPSIAKDAFNTFERRSIHYTDHNQWLTHLNALVEAEVDLRKAMENGKDISDKLQIFEQRRQDIDTLSKNQLEETSIMSKHIVNQLDAKQLHDSAVDAQKFSVKRKISQAVRSMPVPKLPQVELPDIKRQMTRVRRNATASFKKPPKKMKLAKLASTTFKKINRSFFSTKSDKSKPTDESPLQQTPLGAYLESVQIPKEVEDIATIGVERYKDYDKHHLPDPKAIGEDGGGRLKSEVSNGQKRVTFISDNWVEDTFGQGPDTIKSTLKDIPPPTAYSVGEISASLRETNQSKSTNDSNPQFTVVEGFSANDLQAVALGKEAIVQVASQFNYCEAKNSYTPPPDVSEYPKDLTQGPQAAIEAAASAYHRYVAFTGEGAKNHALSKMGIDEAILNECYKNGYLEPSRLQTAKQKKKLLKALRKNINKLEVLPQWVQCEKSGAHQLQVFTAAPSCPKLDQQDELDKAICRELVVAQYKATAQLAVIRANETGEPVPLHLTLVGQGAFNNDPSIMNDAMAAVNEVVKGSNVQVFVHAFNHDITKQVSAAFKEVDIGFKSMTKDEFSHAPALQSKNQTSEENTLKNGEFDWNNRFHIQALFEFSKTQYAQENIEFLFDCAKLKTKEAVAPNSLELEQLRQKIYNDFLKEEINFGISSRTLNLSKQAVDAFKNKDVSELTASDLNECIKEAFKSLDTDKIPNLIKAKWPIPTLISHEVKEFIDNSGVELIKPFIPKGSQESLNVDVQEAINEGGPEDVLEPNLKSFIPDLELLRDIQRVTSNTIPGLGRSQMQFATNLIAAIQALDSNTEFKTLQAGQGSMTISATTPIGVLRELLTGEKLETFNIVIDHYCSKDLRVYDPDLKYDAQLLKNNLQSFVKDAHQMITQPSETIEKGMVDEPVNTQPTLKAPTQLDDIKAKAKQREEAQEQAAASEAKAKEAQSPAKESVTFLDKIQEKRKELLGDKKAPAAKEDVDASVEKSNKLKK